MMTEQDDLSYYVRRELDARRMAEQANENGVRKLHTRLAEEYARRAQSALAQLQAKPDQREAQPQHAGFSAE